MQERIVNHGELLVLTEQTCFFAGAAKLSAKQWSIFEIAKQPTHGVERLRQVRTAAPVAASDRSAISGEPAQSRRAADRAARVGADRRERGPLKNAGRSAARRSTSKRARIAGLFAIAELRILAGDAIRQRMKMRLAGDYRPGFL